MWVLLLLPPATLAHARGLSMLAAPLCAQVLLTGLTPSTTYYYRVGGTFGGSALLNEEISFVAAPVPSASRTTRFAVYGDMGTIPLVRAPTRHCCACACAGVHRACVPRCRASR